MVNIKIFLKKFLFFSFFSVILTFFSVTIVNAAIYTNTEQGIFYSKYWLNNPWGIAVDSSNDVYLGFGDESGVKRFDSNLVYTKAYYASDTYEINSIGFDSSNNVYALEDYTGRVLVYKKNGTFLTSWDATTNPDEYLQQMVVAGNKVYILFRNDEDSTLSIHVFNTSGTPQYDFDVNPNEDLDQTGIQSFAVDSSGNVYVSSWTLDGHEWINVFDSDGDYQAGNSWEFSSSSEWHNSITIHNDVIVTSGQIISNNSHGRIQEWALDGESHETIGDNLDFYGRIAVDSNSNYYISGTDLAKYNSDGELVAVKGSFGTGEGQLRYPSSIGHDTLGNVYVVSGTETGSNNKVSKFNSAGIEQTSWTLPHGSVDAPISVQGNSFVYVGSEHNYTDTVDGPFLEKFTTSGSYIGEIVLGGSESDHVYSIATDNEGNIYVSFGGRNEHCYYETCPHDEYVNKYNSSGVFESTIVHVLEWNVYSLAVDTSDNLYTGNLYNHTVDEYDSSGGLIDTFDSGIDCTSIGVDSNGHVYIDNSNGVSINVFDNERHVMSTLQHNVVDGKSFNTSALSISIDDSDYLLVADQRNVYKFFEGHQISTPSDPEADVIDTSTNISIKSGSSYGVDSADVSTELYDNNIPVVSDSSVNLTQDRNWATFNLYTDPGNSVSLVVGLNPTDAPGASSTHTLYVAKLTGQEGVYVCPQATTLEEVNGSCFGGYKLLEGDPNLSTIIIDGVEYWQVDGLSGTGVMGVSSMFEADFPLRDLMTRLQAGVPSNHEINFGTSYYITNPDDTITIGFSSAWNLSTVNIANLSLYNGSNELTLASSPGEDIWGVEIDNGLHQIVFTAPSSGSTPYIANNTPITLYINNEVLINPSSVTNYQITLSILTNVGLSNEMTESGSVDIPIVDSDTVNITGYVNAYMEFDIDTGTGENPTWPAGGDGAVVDCGVAIGLGACLNYTGTGATEQTNYTVDLGNLTIGAVNKSGDSRLHTDGEGIINSIYFDLTTNAASGVVVTYQSLYGELRGPSHNADAGLDYDITTTDGNSDIVPRTRGYGIQLATAPVYKTVGTGTQEVNCGNSSTTYCVMGVIIDGDNTQLPLPIYTTTGPIELGRGKIDVAAAIDGTVVPGDYQDKITFVATSTF